MPVTGTVLQREWRSVDVSAQFLFPSLIFLVEPFLRNPLLLPVYLLRLILAQFLPLAVR
jgi:hypothetical protein